MSIEPYQTREIARGKAILGMLYPESPNFYLHEYAILNRARYAASLPCSECEVKDLLLCSSGQPIIQSVLDSPMVQRSRSFGFVETVSKHLQFTWLCLRMAHS